MKRILVIASLMIVFTLCVRAQKIEPPKLDPTPSTPSQDQLINEGVALHDRGDFDGAIRRYEEVLKENPQNVLALYEMSYSYYQKRDFQKSLELSYKTAQFKSDLVPRIYVQIGSCLDELGDPKNAIETYRSALKIFPSDFLIHYNLAVTHNKTGELDEARASLKKSAMLNPNHASSQLLLAILFDRGSYKTPGLLAVSRFLVLEPASRRTDAGLRLQRKLLQGGVSAGKKENEINIVMDASPKKDEGDFAGIDLAIGLSKAAEKTEKNKDKTEIQLMVGSFDTVLAILSETAKPDRSKFTWTYYVPYFVEMKRQGHQEAFVYYINQKSGLPDVGDWLAANQDKVNAFLKWSKGFPWPRMN